MKKMKTEYVILAVLLLGVFYWFQLRPIQIRKYCYKDSWDTAVEKWQAENPSRAGEELASQSVVDRYYELCLRSKGLK